MLFGFHVVSDTILRKVLSVDEQILVQVLINFTLSNLDYKLRIDCNCDVLPLSLEDLLN